MAPEERASEKDLCSWQVCSPDCLSEVGGDDEGVREGKKRGESSTLEHLGVEYEIRLMVPEMDFKGKEKNLQCRRARLICGPMVCGP